MNDVDFGRDHRKVGGPEKENGFSQSPAGRINAPGPRGQKISFNSRVWEREGRGVVEDKGGCAQQGIENTFRREGQSA